MDRHIIQGNLISPIDELKAALTTCTAEREAAQQRASKEHLQHQRLKLEVVTALMGLSRDLEDGSIPDAIYWLRAEREKAEAELVTLRAQLDRYLK